MKNSLSLLLVTLISVSGYAQNDEFVPQWAKSAIWYQIFPDRFYNGDKTNDPTMETLVGADPQEKPKQWQIHPWTSDWFKLQPDELANGEPELWKHILRRRYGGDLQGIILKLDYLKDLGINAIYLNPVFDAPSLHKYDGASYHHIDPNFGPDPVGDRKLMATEDPINPSTWVWTKADELALKLIDEAHKRGIRIIFDGVFNHMGIKSFAFQDLLQKQEKSVYKDWFIVKQFEDKAKGKAFEYEGWFGVKSLPELKEDSNGIVKGPKDYIFAATQRWMNPKGLGKEKGIDGWRLDVAFCVGHPFWKDWRKWVKSINPDAYLTAEIVNTPEFVKPYLLGDEFDAEMNYNFAFTAIEYMIDPKNKISATAFDQELEKLRNLYPKGVAYVLQNLYGSHDVNRIASHIVNRGIGSFRDWNSYFNISQAAKNPNYQVRKPNQTEIELQKLLVIFQMTYLGAPMIYYGDEVGMWGGNDPDCRKPMVWKEFKYDDEKNLPNQVSRNADEVAVNADLLNHYKNMIGIRNRYACLSLGAYKTITADNQKDVFVFERSLNNQKVLVYINNSEKPQKFSLPKTQDNWYDLDNNSKITGEFEIKGKWAKVIANEVKR